MPGHSSEREPAQGREGRGRSVSGAPSCMSFRGGGEGRDMPGPGGDAVA